MSEIDELKQDLEHKKIAIQNRNAKIEELEDCIKDLQKDCENKTDTIADFTSKLATCNDRIAELKIKNENADSLNNKLEEDNYNLTCNLNATLDRLDEATELLKHWLNSYGGVDVALCKQTQQFINEVEKKTLILPSM